MENKTTTNGIETTAKQRVEAEAEQLEERYLKLSAFLTTDKFNGMREADKDYLLRQRKAMWDYLSILRCRLSIWEDKA